MRRSPGAARIPGLELPALPHVFDALAALAPPEFYAEADRKARGTPIRP